MKCKYATKRAAYSESVPQNTDSGIRNVIENNNRSFGTCAYSGDHNLQVWRQAYKAEARKRGLLT